MTFYSFRSWFKASIRFVRSESFCWFQVFLFEIRIFVMDSHDLLSHHARILTRNQHLFIFDFSACTDCPLLTAVMTCSMPPGYCRGMWQSHLFRFPLHASRLHIVVGCVFFLRHSEVSSSLKITVAAFHTKTASLLRVAILLWFLFLFFSRCPRFPVNRLGGV